MKESIVFNLSAWKKKSACTLVDGKLNYDLA